MKITIEFSTDNDAFVDNYNHEIKCIMNDVRLKHLHDQCDGGNIYDSNGNRIGQWKVEE